MNNMNMNFNQAEQTCPCQKQQKPGTCEPIVLPCKVCCVNRCYPVEQPIIVPMHTKIVNHYVPRPRYYPTYTTSEENVSHCSRQQNNY